MKLNNREVVVTSMEPGDGTMMITSAYYVDIESELADYEIAQLESDYPEYLDELYLQHQVIRAESAFEGDR